MKSRDTVTARYFILNMDTWSTIDLSYQERRENQVYFDWYMTYAFILSLNIKVTQKIELEVKEIMIHIHSCWKLLCMTSIVTEISEEIIWYEGKYPKTKISLHFIRAQLVHESIRPHINHTSISTDINIA